MKASKYHVFGLIKQSERVFFMNEKSDDNHNKIHHKLPKEKFYSGSKEQQKELQLFDLMYSKQISLIEQFKQMDHVIAFLKKTITILENEQYSQIISWDNNGRYIEIKDEMRFENEILPKEFKHNKIGSFIRQLNMYGFKKIKNTCFKSFFNPLFQKGNMDNILRIKRRKNCKLIQKLEKQKISFEMKEKQIQLQKLQTMKQIQQELKKPLLIPHFFPSFDLNQFSYMSDYSLPFPSMEQNWFQKFSRLTANFH